MDLYTSTGLNNTHMFSEKEVEQILKAIRAISRMEIWRSIISIASSRKTRTTATLNWNIIVQAGMIDNWMYYYDYYNSLEKLEGKAVDGQEMTAGGNLYLTFGPDCVHIVETLEKLGITNDEWKLMTNQEMMQ